MKMLGTIVAAVLGIAVIAEGAYIVRTRTQLATLSEKLGRLESERMDTEGRGPPIARGFEREGLAEEMGIGAPEPSTGDAQRRPLPRFVPAPSGPPPSADDPLPLPAAINSPEARLQLRNYIAAQLEQRRQEERAAMDDRRQQQAQQRRERMAKELGLASGEAAKFNDIHTRADAARAQLMERMQSEAGGDRRAIRQEMVTIRSGFEQEMRSLLGEGRAQKWEELRRQEGPDFGGGGGPRGGPRGGWRGAQEGPPPGATP